MEEGFYSALGWHGDALNGSPRGTPEMQWVFFLFPSSSSWCGLSAMHLWLNWTFSETELVFSVTFGTACTVLPWMRNWGRLMDSTSTRQCRSLSKGPTPLPPSQSSTPYPETLYTSDGDRLTLPHWCPVSEEWASLSLWEPLSCGIPHLWRHRGRNLERRTAIAESSAGVLARLTPTSKSLGVESLGFGGRAED